MNWLSQLSGIHALNCDVTKVDQVLKVIPTKDYQSTEEKSTTSPSLLQRRTSGLFVKPDEDDIIAFEIRNLEVVPNSLTGIQIGGNTWTKDSVTSIAPLVHIKLHNTELCWVERINNEVIDRQSGIIWHQFVVPPGVRQITLQFSFPQNQLFTKDKCGLHLYLHRCFLEPIQYNLTHSIQRPYLSSNSAQSIDTLTRSRLSKLHSSFAKIVLFNDSKCTSKWLDAQTNLRQFGIDAERFSTFNDSHALGCLNCFSKSCEYVDLEYEMSDRSGDIYTDLNRWTRPGLDGGEEMCTQDASVLNKVSSFSTQHSVGYISQIIQSAQQQGLANILILSDQCDPRLDIESQWKDLMATMPQQWDVLFLGGFCKESNQAPDASSSEKWIKLSDNGSDELYNLSVRGIYAIAIRKTAYDKIFDKIMKEKSLNVFSSTELIAQIPNLNVYITSPQLFSISPHVMASALSIQPDALSGIFGNYDTLNDRFYCDPGMYSHRHLATDTHLLATQLQGTQENRVSIIMLVENNGDSLLDAVFTVVMQSYTNWQLIVVDNASDDHTTFLTKELETTDNRIRVIRLPSKVSFLNQVEHALKLVDGEYISFFDVSELSMKYRLSRQIQEMSTHPTLLLTCGFVDPRDEKGGAISTCVQASVSCSTLMTRTSTLRKILPICKGNNEAGLIISILQSEGDCIITQKMLDAWLDDPKHNSIKYFDKILYRRTPTILSIHNSEN